MGTIPKEIVVGFRKRDGTFNDKLSFVTHYMTKKKDKVRYNENFKKWKDDEIPLEEYENIPMEGFVFHDRAGGNKCWTRREKKMRVWDPRGWEFEIGMDSIEHIVSNSDIIGGELIGEFVYGWFGLEGLCLISTKSEEYRAQFKIVKSIKPSELIEGNMYLAANGYKMIYIGKYLQFTYLKKGSKNIGKDVFKSIDAPDKEYYFNSKMITDLGPATDNVDKPNIFHDNYGYNDYLRINHTLTEIAPCQKIYQIDFMKGNTQVEGFFFKHEDLKHGDYVCKQISETQIQILKTLNYNYSNGYKYFSKIGVFDITTQVFTNEIEENIDPTGIKLYR